MAKTRFKLVVLLSLRRVLAPLWTSGVAAWLLGAVAAYAPDAERVLFDELLHELARQVPRLTARLQLPRCDETKIDPLAPSEGAVAPAGGAWLAWLSVDSKQCARWERRLRSLLPLRLLRASPPAPQPPDQWCGAALQGLRTQLNDVLADAGSVRNASEYSIDTIVSHATNPLTPLGNWTADYRDLTALIINNVHRKNIHHNLINFQDERLQFLVCYE